MISVCVKLKASYHLIPDSIWQEITPAINVLNTILIPGRGSERTHYPTLARIAITIHLNASVSSLILSGYSYRESYTAQGKQGHHTQIGARCNLRNNQVRNNLEAHLVIDAMLKICDIGINWLPVFVTKPADCSQHQSISRRLAARWRHSHILQLSSLRFTTFSYRVRV